MGGNKNGNKLESKDNMRTNWRYKKNKRKLEEEVEDQIRFAISVLPKKFNLTTRKIYDFLKEPCL